VSVSSDWEIITSKRLLSLVLVSSLQFARSQSATW
jgi:hypothetical protein